jgi:hypothetical protein
MGCMGTKRILRALDPKMHNALKRLNILLHRILDRNKSH